MPNSLRIGIALAAGLFLLGVAAPGHAAPTVSQCTAKWNQSSASETCSNETITVEGNDCVIEATCERAWPYDPVSASIRDWLENIHRAVNCDGVLRMRVC